MKILRYLSMGLVIVGTSAFIGCGDQLAPEDDPNHTPPAEGSFLGGVGTSDIVNVTKSLGGASANSMQGVAVRTKACNVIDKPNNALGYFGLRAATGSKAANIVKTGVTALPVSDLTTLVLSIFAKTSNCPTTITDPTYLAKGAVRAAVCEMCSSNIFVPNGDLLQAAAFSSTQPSNRPYMCDPSYACAVGKK